MADESRNGDGSNHLGDVLRGVMADWVLKSCAICNLEFSTNLEDATICAQCQRDQVARKRIEQQAAQIQANMHVWIDKAMAKWGISTRERQATFEQINPKIKSVIAAPELQVFNLHLGVIPSKGFGLVGPTGIGKTCAMAAIVKLMIESRWRHRMHADGFGCLRQFVYWLRWPEQVNSLRQMAASDQNGIARCQDMARVWANADVLVIDDLGAERLKSEYETDWATSLLDMVIDHRYNEMRPIYYTSNLLVDELVDRYGSRMFSRLVGQNPALVAPSGPDLRMIRNNRII